MPDTTSQIILGLGNILNSDEGFGVEAMKFLQEAFSDNTNVEFIDGGVMGLDLLPLVESCSHLLILDAIDAGSPPGTIIEMSRDEIPLYNNVKMSEHQITFQEVLGFAKLREKLPEHLHLIGVQPESTSLGVGLSETLNNRLPEVIKAGRKILLEWGLLNSEVSNFIQ